MLSIRRCHTQERIVASVRLSARAVSGIERKGSSQGKVAALRVSVLFGIDAPLSRSLSVAVTLHKVIRSLRGYNMGTWKMGAFVVIQPQSRKHLDWPAKLDLLRSYHLPKESRELTPKRAAEFLGASVDDHLLDGLRSLQRIAWDIDHGPLPSHAIQTHSKQGLKPPEIEARMIKYLKEKRADLPQREENGGGLYSSELFRAVAKVCQEERLNFTKEMQRIAPGVPPVELKPSLKNPYEMLQRLVQANAAAITLWVSFDTDRALVVHLSSRNPIGALLLSALDLMSRGRNDWAACMACGNPFPKRRKDQRACNQAKCKNTLHMREKRARKATHTEKKKG